MKNLIFILISAMALVSCGQSQGPKTLQITSALVYSSNYTGGLVVRGFGPNNKKFTLTSQGSGTLTIPLADGNWTIYAVGWTGAQPFSGTSQCGKKVINLAAADTSIDIDVNSAGCTSADFSGAFTETADSSGFQDLRIFNCLSLQYGATGTSFESTTPTPLVQSNFCMASALPLDMQKRAAAYRIVIPNEVDPQLSLTTACLPTSGNSLINTGLKIPTDKIPVRIELHKDQSCQDDVVIHEFKEGLITDSKPTSGFFHTLASLPANALLLAFNTPKFGMTPFYTFLPELTDASGAFYTPKPTTTGVNFYIDTGTDHFSRVIVSKDPSAICSDITSPTGVTLGSCSIQEEGLVQEMRETANCSSSCSINFKGTVLSIQSTNPRNKEILGAAYRHMGSNLTSTPTLLNMLNPFNDKQSFGFGDLDHVREMLGPDSPVGYFGTQSCVSLNEEKTLSVLDEGQLKVFQVIVRDSTEAIPKTFCDKDNRHPAACPVNYDYFDKQIIFREFRGSFQTRFNMHVHCDQRIGMLEMLELKNDQEVRDERQIVYWNTENKATARYENYRSETQFSDTSKTQITRRSTDFNHAEIQPSGNYYVWAHGYNLERGNIETSEHLSKTEFVSAPSKDLLSSSIHADLNIANANFGLPGMSIFEKPLSVQDFKLTRLDQLVTSPGTGPFAPSILNYDYDQIVIGTTTVQAIVYRGAGTDLLKLKYFNGTSWIAEVPVPGTASVGVAYPKVSIGDDGSVSVAWLDSNDVKYNRFNGSTWASASPIPVVATPAYPVTNLAVASTTANNAVVMYVEEGSPSRVLNTVRITNITPDGTPMTLNSLSISQKHVFDSLRIKKIGPDNILVTWAKDMPAPSFSVDYNFYQPSTASAGGSQSVSMALPPGTPMDFKFSTTATGSFYSWNYGPAGNNRHHVKYTPALLTYGSDQNMSYNSLTSLNDCTSTMNFTTPGNCASVVLPVQTFEPVKALAPNIESMNPLIFNNVFTPVSTFINIQ